MRFPFIILLCLCAFSAFDLPPMTASIGKMDSGKKDTEKATVISNPATSFQRNGTIYYWLGNFQPAPSTPKKCIFMANHPDWPFKMEMFPNGSAPAGVEFGCKEEDTCRKYHCDQSMPTGLYWGIFLILATILTIAIIVRYVLSRRHEDRTEQDTELRSVYVPVASVEREAAITLVVPSNY